MVVEQKFSDTLAKIETPEVVKRHYGVAFVNDGVKIIAYPSAFVVAAVILSTEKELDERLKAWQAFRKEHYGRGFHKRPDSPLFKLDGKYRQLLDVPASDLKKLLLERIVKEEGAQTLYRCEPDEAVKNGGFGTHFLFGDARRKENARGDTTTRHVTVGNPLLDRGNHIGTTKVECGECNSKRYEDTKEARVNPICYHAAEVWEAFWMSIRGKRDLVRFKDGIPKNPTIPFNLTPDDLWGLYLDIDTLVSRYILGETLFSIDRKLMRLGGLSNPLEAMIRVGEANFQVVRQRFREQVMPRRYIQESRALLIKMRRALEGNGFTRVGYVLEYEHTKYETVAERYTKGNKAVSICYRNDLPVHYVYRELGKFIDLNGDRKVINPEHPFSRLRMAERNIDDCTRRECISRILLPQSRTGKKGIYIPQRVHQAYINIQRMLI